MADESNIERASINTRSKADHQRHFEQQITDPKRLQESRAGERCIGADCWALKAESAGREARWSTDWTRTLCDTFGDMISKAKIQRNPASRQHSPTPGEEVEIEAMQCGVATIGGHN